MSKNKGGMRWDKTGETKHEENNRAKEKKNVRDEHRTTSKT